jgi:aryl-alcohol dehydrogenase-like predicted oxidoreductase
MRTRSLGAGAPAVAAIGFGGMPLSTAGRPPEDLAIRTVHAALEGGVTLIDTANVYCLDDHDLGHNERLIAKALASWPHPRDGVIVATKGGMTRPEGRWERNGGRPEQLRRACEDSLKALGVERIDLYQYHAPDPTVPFADSVGALAELRSQGKIRWVGLSNVSVAQIEEASAIVPITAVQNRLSPFFREALERGVVQHCGGKGIGFLAYSPVGGGRLNRKLPDHPVVRPIAERLGISPHAVVLAWVLAQGPTVIPIPGGRTPEHVRDAIGAAEVRLSQEDVAAITGADFSTA